MYDGAGQPLRGFAVAAESAPRQGTGEGSAVPGPVAIANAVADALGVEVTDPVNDGYVLMATLRPG